MTRTLRQAAHDVPGVKARALTAAATILAEQGADDLSLRAIAEAAGIGLASIYHYFANKEALLLSLALMGYEDLRRDIEGSQAVHPSVSPMRAGARAFFAFAQSRPSLFSLMCNARLLARHEALREAEHRMFLAYKTTVEVDARIPTRHQENRRLRPVGARPRDGGDHRFPPGRPAADRTAPEAVRRRGLSDRPPGVGRRG